MILDTLLKLNMVNSKVDRRENPTFNIPEVQTKSAGVMTSTLCVTSRCISLAQVDRGNTM